MELTFKKLGNSIGITFPASFVREMRVSEGQVVSVDAKEDGTITLRPKIGRKRYTAAELNAQCDMSAPMPDDLLDWDSVPPVGSESL
jgi:antitoxin ChpS